MQVSEQRLASDIKPSSSLGAIVSKVTKVSTNRAGRIWGTKQSDLRFVVIEFKETLAHPWFNVRRAGLMFNKAAGI